jgi:antitoxin (DNA-binding transcriptional repressor) of toxin-antitoxin stability system
MTRVYSVYEAKARLSEIIRHVRERGDSVTISYHGEPVAEVRALTRPENDLDRRLADLEHRGVVAPARSEAKTLPRLLARRPGALTRFLEERDA